LDDGRTMEEPMKETTKEEAEPVGEMVRERIVASA
jgi:hypothetical protein